MKLPIKKKYFDMLKKGLKIRDYRDAHITFVCVETGELLIKKVVRCQVERHPPKFYTDVLEDDEMIVFELGD